MQRIKGMCRLWSLERGLLDDASMANMRSATDYYVSKEENTNIVNAILRADNLLLKRKPEFVYAHFFMPHHPFCYTSDGALNIRKVQFDGKFNQSELDFVLLCYRQEILFVDHVIKKYIAKLKRNREYDNAMIVITTDHGVSWEPGNNGRHVSRVNDMLAHVPMLIKFPRQKTSVVDSSPHTHLDFMPTVLNAFGMDYSQCEGKPVEMGKPTPHNFFYNRQEWARDPKMGKWHVVNPSPAVSLPPEPRLIEAGTKGSKVKR